MRISEVEKLVGISKKNIRFYEDEGLLSPKREIENGYRNYSDDDVKDLKNIKLLRKLGVPIEEIRKLRGGTLTLSDCMRRHEIYLSGQQRTIEYTKAICEELAEANEAFATFDADVYHDKIHELEQGGAVFVGLKDGDNKKKRRKDAIFWASIMTLFFLGMLALFVSLFVEETPPIAVMIILIGIIVLLIIGVIAALRERLKEIAKGEEDEAFNY